MNKNILAIAIAAAVAAPSAFAAATVYGNAHMSVNSVSGVNASTTTTGAVNGASTGITNVTSNSSFLGVKGSEDLGAGMKAVYQMEFGVNLDGETGGLASSRNTFVGLGGGFGTVLVGRHDSPIKMVGRKYDVFGDQVGNNRVILGNYSNGTAGTTNTVTTSHLVDGRHNNVIAYATPTFGGFNALIAYVPGADATSNGNENFDSAANKINAWSANAMYKAGNFDAGLGYITASNVLDKSAPAGGDTAFTATRLGAGYTFGAARINGIYQTNDYVSGTSVKALSSYGIGGTYKVTAAGTVKAQYMITDNTRNNKDGANSITVGYDHAMSKNTTVYAVYAAVDNNNGTGNDGRFSVMQNNSGTNDTTYAVAGKDNSAFAVGVQHKF